MNANRLVLSFLAVWEPTATGQQQEERALENQQNQYDALATMRQLTDSIPQLTDAGFLANPSATTESCTIVTSAYRCNFETDISTDDGDETNLQIQVQCPIDEQTTFDFRKAAGCSCGARISNLNGDNATVCPCTVCQNGFGHSAISMDCSTKDDDPFIISSCSSLDCDLACNGTCQGDCGASGGSGGCPSLCSTPSPSTVAPSVSTAPSGAPSASAAPSISQAPSTTPTTQFPTFAPTENATADFNSTDLSTKSPAKEPTDAPTLIVGFIVTRAPTEVDNKDETSRAAACTVTIWLAGLVAHIWTVLI
mmetsp:Transcript_17656/g.48095  ORF Transcript_17656/g.48095 Transcript_17656/m.48095 type:complete len:309 (-) Transcript_17656:101-1027(-)